MEDQKSSGHIHIYQKEPNHVQPWSWNSQRRLTKHFGGWKEWDKRKRRGTGPAEQAMRTGLRLRSSFQRSSSMPFRETQNYCRKRIFAKRMASRIPMRHILCIIALDLTSWIQSESVNSGLRWLMMAFWQDFDTNRPTSACHHDIPLQASININFYEEVAGLLYRLSILSLGIMAVEGEDVSRCEHNSDVASLPS